MLDDSPYYFHTLRNLMVVFGDVFNGIHVTKEDSDGNIVKTLRVPIDVSRRQKYISRLREDQIKNADNTAAFTELTLPRMSYDFTAIEPNPAKQLNARNLQIRSSTVQGVQDYLRQMSGRPITVSMQLSIYTNTIDEMWQIVEQIVPYFVPDFNVNILDIPELDIRKDVPIVLAGIGAEDSFEGDMMDFRLIEWTLDFTCDIELYPPVKEGGIIRKVITDIRDKDPLKYVNITHELDPIDANETDPYTVITTITDY